MSIKLCFTKIRSNFPGGRMIATSKLTNDEWKLFWIDDEDDHVLNSRDFSLVQCRWKSRVRIDQSVAGAVVDMLVDLTHERDRLRQAHLRRHVLLEADFSFQKGPP
uniref:Uncharacterized protein n=1 Tax=Trichogramma kaykai TaxID=54128 RepID=A0ABD2XJA5_9HYME